MSSSPASPSTSTWSSWLRDRFFSASPWNFSLLANDGDHSDRMLDDLTVMELRDGKRVNHPWDGPSERGSERTISEYFDDNASVSSSILQMTAETFSEEEKRYAAFSTPKKTASSAATSDIGFYSPGGRRYLSFAECQQLPKTDYMYAYTEVYSPNIYQNRDIEMPNMCRQPIRSSSHGTSSRSLRSRTSGYQAKSIPVYGTDGDNASEFSDAASSYRAPVSSSSSRLFRLHMFFVNIFSAICFYFITCCQRVKLATLRFISCLASFFYLTFVSLPLVAASFAFRKIWSLPGLFYRGLLFAIAQPTMAAASFVGQAASHTKNVAAAGATTAAHATGSSTQAVIAGANTVVTFFWLTIRRTSSAVKETCVSASAWSLKWLRRFFWPLLLLILFLLLLFVVPYDRVLNSASDTYNRINVSGYLDNFKTWADSWGQPSAYSRDEIAGNGPPEPDPSKVVSPSVESRAAEVVVGKVDCVDCWKPFSENVLKLLDDRDREIFSKLEFQLASTTALVAEQSEEKFTAAAERIATLEAALTQLHSVIADAKVEARKALEEAEAMRSGHREEDKAAMNRVMDEMWSRVDAKLTQSTDALERQLAEEQRATQDKIDSFAAERKKDLQASADRTQQTANEALAIAKQASADVAAIPPPLPPPPQQPVTVECKTACPVPEPTPSGRSSDGLSRHQIETIVGEAITRYDADRTGLPDFALESSGGSVVSVRCSKTYDVTAGTVSIFGFPVYFDTKSPRTAIQAGHLVPGNCWAFSGSRGFLVVRLSYKIAVTSISLEHIARQLAPLGRVDSAPRDFSVYGLESETDTVGHLLGNYTYDADGLALQMFNTKPEQQEMGLQFVELRVLSNYGNPNYTCIYRFRVHGNPVDETTENNPLDNDNN